MQALESGNDESGVGPDDMAPDAPETQGHSLEVFEMAVTQRNLFQDPTAWPWPGGRWRLLAMDRPRAGARSRSVRVRTVALVAFQAFVLVVALSVAARLGATSWPDVGPGRAVAPTAPFAPVPGPLLPPEPLPGS